MLFFLNIAGFDIEPLFMGEVVSIESFWSELVKGKLDKVWYKHSCGELRWIRMGTQYEIVCPD